MDRETFLENIARQLKRTRSQPPVSIELENYGSQDGDETIHPPIIENLIGSFKTELEALGGTVYLEVDPEAASRRLRSMVEELKLERMVIWAKEEFVGWPLDWLWNQPGCLPWPSRPEARAQQSQWRQKALEADAGITTAEFAVAETGSLLLDTAPGKPRSASLLPKHHIALVRRAQFVLRLEDALSKISRDSEGFLPSGCFLITGPSRTSDIENDLTIGVHGPADLTVLIA